MPPPNSARRTGFSRRAQYGLFLSYVIAATGAVVGLVLVLLSHFDPPAFAAMRSGVAEITTPISSGLAGVRRVVASPAGLLDYFGGADQVRALRRQVDEERGVVMRARTLARENARLRRLLALRDAEAAPVVVARLVASSASSTRRFATLDAGRLQGVRPGQPVRGPEGLIGRVLETGFNTARVLLITDPDSVVPVRRTRDGMPGIATGRGDGLIEIRSAAAANVPFSAGDIFVTSGTGGLYPPNVAVARVVADARDSAVAQPYANPDALDFAIVHRVFLPELPPPPPGTPR